MSRLLVITPTLGRSSVFGATVHSVMSLAASGLPIIYRVIGPLAARECVESKLGELNKSGVDALFVAENNVSGLYSAINQAVGAEVSADWSAMTYINDDDCISSDFYQSWLGYLSAQDKHPFSYGEVRLIDEAGCSLGKVPIEPDGSQFEALLAQGISPLNQQGMIIPRALWEKLGGFRTEYKLCADLDFWLRAHRMGWPFKYYSIEVGQFRIREGQLSGDSGRLEKEIAAVVARDAPRKIGALEKFYARWQFRIKNFPIYFSRFMHGRRVRGMKMLAGK